jgi:hypothetical protein
MTGSEALARWKSMTQAAVQRWNRLTDRDLDTVRGNAERMVELLQARYGIERREALAELELWRRSLATGAAGPRTIATSPLGGVR